MKFFTSLPFLSAVPSLLSFTRAPAFAPLVGFAAILAIALSPAPVAAEQAAPQPGDYATAREISVRAAGTLYKIRLTPPILRDVKFSSAREIAVFNASGDLLPFLVRDASPHDMPGQSGVAQTQLERTTVPTFTLPASLRREASPHADVIVRSTPDGQIVEVRGRQESEGGSGAPTDGKSRFLLDLSEIFSRMAPGDEIASLKLEISLANDADVASTVDVETSDNLRDWTRVASREPLLSLRSGGERIDMGAVEVASPRRYLTLTIDGDARVIPDNVFVTPSLRRATPRFEPDRVVVGGVRSGDRTFIYDVGAAYPAEAIRFTLQNPGIHRVEIFSRNDAEATWRARGSQTLSLVRNASGDVTNGPFDTTAPTDRHWLLETRDRLLSPPEMTLSWAPKEVIFMAQGAAPYLLCVGAADDDTPLRVLQNRRLIEPVLAGLSEPAIEAAQLGAPEIPEKKIPPTPQPPEDEPKPWGRYAVWTLLAGGALLLSWMAWSLMRKDREGKKQK